MWYQLTRVKLRHSFKLACNILQHKGTSYWIFAISCNKVMHFWTNINNPLLFTYVFEPKCGNEFAYSTVNCQSILTIQGHYSEKSNKSLDHIKQKWTKMDLKGQKCTEMDWNGPSNSPNSSFGTHFQPSFSILRVVWAFSMKNNAFVYCNLSKKWIFKVKCIQS